ncbi:unnamed protein product, partial [Oppiella nova]
REDSHKFEFGRIKALQEERLHIQKKTFTKWTNSFLQKARLEVDDIFTDLSDGKNLLKLLEIISGEKLGKPNNGKMRVHKIENVNKSLAFLHTKVRLESIGAEDIVDGNKRLILGLLWTIILRFQIQDIEIQVDEESSEKKHAKEALLLWCQRKTSGYPYVDVRDFTQSWRSGMAFNALIHAHRPDLINYNALNPNNPIDTLNNAFDVAQRDLGVSKLLDAEDVDTAKPDEKSVLTYVSSYYHTFAKMNSEMKGGRRIANIVAQLIDVDRHQLNYEMFTTNLLNWIQMKIIELEDRTLANSLDGIQKEFLKFKEYRTVEKPPKYKERSEIEVLLFNIQTKMKSLGQPLYTPPEGKLVQDIEKSWTALEKAEYRREVVLREELLRLEKLENIAFSFERKSVLREGYLKEMIQVLSDPRYGSNLTQVEATVKKHEAISADILARSERFKSLTVMAQELIDGNYHSSDAIKQREQNIAFQWQQLLDLLQRHQNNLNTASSFMSSLREVETIRNEIKEMEKSLTSDANVVVNHLLAVEDLLQRHTLIEAHISSQGETIRKLNNISTNLMKNDKKQTMSSDAIELIGKEAPLLVKGLESLNNEYSKLKELSKLKRLKLEELRAYYQFVQDVEEEEATLSERQRICQAILPSKDLLAVISLQQKHSVLETEIKAHKNRLKKVIDSGEQLIAAKHPESADIKVRIESLTSQWDKLHELADQKSKQLSDAMEAFQYHTDANEAESWMKEKMQLVTSEDYGKDEPSALALLQRHSRLESEISAYENDIKRLNTQSDKMIKSGIASLFMICGDAFSAATAAGSGDTDEGLHVPTEEWVDELVEKEIIQEVVEEIRIPQVIALYPFTGQENFVVAKGEHLVLLQKTNNDWWSVRKDRERKDGFVPANYVKEIEPKIIKKLVKKPIKVWEKQKVKKFVNRKPMKKTKRNSKRRLSIICDAESVEQRKKNINSSFDELTESCKIRRQYLEDAIQLFRFNRECDGFESWIKDTETAIIDTTRLYQQQKSQQQDLTDPIEKLRKKFENFITELSANRSRLEEIDRLADEFTCGRAQHYSSAIKQRQNQIHKKWEKLNRMMTELGKNVEGLTTVDMFNNTCDETAEWMLEKLDKIDVGGDFGKDLKTVQALHRRHDNIERELAAVEEKFNKVNLLAESVKNSYPTERNNVTIRQKELADIWERVKDKANERRAKLDESLGLQVLKNSANDLLNWIRRDVKQSLNNDDINLAKDVATVEHLIEKHEDLGKEISAHNDEFNDLRLLAKQLIKQMGNEEVLPILNELNGEQDAIHRRWQEKNNWLRQCKDLMIFNQEADQLDTLTNSHMTFLEFNDLGETLESVYGLQKRHENFIATLLAQDERLHLFGDMADKLIDAKHYDSPNIESRRKQVIERRRKKLLEISLKMQHLLSEATEVESWMNEKFNIMNSNDFGTDEDTAIKLLTKQKAIELEVDTYSVIIVEMSRQSRELCQSCRVMADDETDGNHSSPGSPSAQSDLNSDEKLIVNRMQDIDQQMKALQRLVNQRRLRLIQSKHFHEFMRESDQFLSWISEQMVSALSEDFGKDYEHLLILQSKFFDFKRKIQSNEERYRAIVESGHKLTKKRYRAIVESGHKLTKSEPLDAVDRRVGQLEHQWNQLLDALEAREQKLSAAQQIHRFNRDVAEALSRISDKFSVINSSDLGKDLHSVESLIRKHEVFENDLVALEAQLQVLIDDSVRLQAAYPGGNAQHIAEQQSIVVEHWEALQQKVVIRKAQLQQSYQLQALVASVRDLEHWALGLDKQMETIDKVRDAQSAQLARVDHQRLKAEIEAREPVFGSVLDTARLIAGQTNTEDPDAPTPHTTHYAIQEINHMLDRVVQLRDCLHKKWQLKKVYLDQLIDVHFFIRDCKQLDQLSQQQETRLQSDDLGLTVEEVEQNLKKHEAFEKVVQTHDEKLLSLQESGLKLIKQNHFESELIKSKLDEISGKRLRVKEMCFVRRQRLNDSLVLAQFRRDAVEADNWIDSKAKQLETSKQDINSRVNSLEEKIKQLQKHQSFQLELQANEPNIKSIKQKADYLISKSHEKALEIRSQLEQLIYKWNQLLDASQERGRGLEEAQDMLEFNQNVEKVESWIREKELMVGHNDTGEDFEHCLALQRKLDDVDSDMRRLKQINLLADKLLRQHHSQTQTSQSQPQSTHIDRRRQQLNDKWKDLQILIDCYRNKLLNAAEVHRFNRDLCDLDQRIQEKSLILDNEEEAKNLEGVEALQRKQEAIEREVNAIEIRLKDLVENEGRKLINKYPDMTANCRNKINEVQDNWRHLSKLCHIKRNRLSSAYTLHKFLEELKETEIWANNLINHRMKESLNISNTITDVRNDLQLHEDIKTEIMARKEVFQYLKEFGHKLLQQLSQNSSDEQNEDSNKQLIENGLIKLDELRRSLDQVWEERKHYLTQSLQLQLFIELMKQSDDWLSSKEAFLNNEDLGDSLAGVESLIRKHDNFEKTLTTQQRIEELGKFANDLVQTNHFDSENILTKCRSAVARKDRLLESSKQRKNKLNDSKLFHKFLRNVNEILGWLNEKLKVASDESYRDPINLLSKIQKHAAFEAELAANKGRVDAVVNEGEALISCGHFMSDEIQNHLQHIEKSWRNLLDETNLKKERLQDAYQALQFHRMLDDLELWMSDMETVLADEDHGKDLISSQNIMKKHQLIENDINNHSENIEQIKDLTTAFTQNNHFMKEEIEERAQTVIHRYEALHEPMQIRRENLEEALLLFQFKRDIDDELIWIEEKQIQVMATELGSSLFDVQKLRKKHQSLEAEIGAREPLLTTIISKGHSLIRSQHFASTEIEALISELQNKIQTLKDGAAIRRLRLLDAIESQQFYSDVLEAEHWWSERMPFLESEEIGRDEESIVSLNKKLDLIKRDSERFVSTNLSKTYQLGNALIERNHFDSQSIQSKISELELKFHRLNELCAKKALKLSENRKHFSFIRDADELLIWIREQMIIACSEDYGQDVEHVELLIQRFDNFIINLNSNEERIISLRSSAEELEENNAKLNHVLMAWNELKDTAQSRQDALHGAKQVHTFDRSADETIAWIHEKDSSTALDESYTPDDDLQSIQAMIRSHEGFERDLAAVREQVEALLEEAKRLASLFPDASEHIFAKNDEVRESWNELLQRSAQRRHHLLETETLQTYFDEYRELMASINEMIALITAEDELANQDVISAETQLNRHKEYKTEIDARNDSFVKCAKEGEIIIESGHFMAGEVRERIDRLNGAHKNLIDIWNKRRVIFEHNLDAQQFKHDAQQLERWIASRENMISDDNLGDSIADVEDLIRKHEDFEKAIIAQEEKVKAIQRLTLIEDDFRHQKQEEERMKRVDIARREHERVQQIKQREQMRILDERRHEDNEFYDRDNGEGVRKSSHEIDVNSKGLVKRMENLLAPKAIKRAESVKFASPKRTPSFTTRRRSFRSTKTVSVEPDQLPPVECEGLLDRKQELQTGGKRATVRSWKTYYTVLCGQLLCFFKDKDSFFGNQASAPPFSVLGAKCVRAHDYTKRKHVFRLQLSDGSEYLFTNNDENRMQEWLNKIAFHASLPPAMQLLSYDAHKDASIYSAGTSPTKPDNSDTQSSPQSNTVSKYDTSSQSSSSPELSRKSSVSSNPMGSTPVAPRPSLPLPTNVFPSVPPPDAINKRPAPPLPPPRTTNTQKSFPEEFESMPNLEFPPQQRPISDGYDHRIDEMDHQRRNNNNFRQSFPQREASHTTHTNGNHNNGHNNEMVVNSFNPFSAHLMPGLSQIPHIPQNTAYNAYPIRAPYNHMLPPKPVPYPMYATFPTTHETDSESEEWLSHHLDLRYAQTTYQNIPVARHMSLPPNSRQTNQLEPTYSSGKNSMTNITTSSEEEISNSNPNKNNPKKKGVMSFFKRK